MHVLCLILVLVLLVQLEVPHMSPDHDVSEEGEDHQARGDPAHQVPQLVRVVQLAIGHLPTPLAPHSTGAVWKNIDCCISQSLLSFSRLLY